jgi:hypothetical protein
MQGRASFMSGGASQVVMTTATRVATLPHSPYVHLGSESDSTNHAYECSNRTYESSMREQGLLCSAVFCRAFQVSKARDSRCQRAVVCVASIRIWHLSCAAARCSTSQRLWANVVAPPLKVLNGGVFMFMFVQVLFLDMILLYVRFLFCFVGLFACAISCLEDLFLTGL